MKKFGIFLLVIILSFLFFVVYQKPTKNSEKLKQPKKDSVSIPPKPKLTMKITSPAFSNSGRVPSKYTCDGDNINPPIEFQDVPPDARSLVLIVDDPDAPARTWVHWVVYNIDPRTKQVKENSVPVGGVLGVTDSGKSDYGGPCPPSGTHRYFFKLYALNTMLDLPGGLTKQQILEKMNDHVLEQAQLIGLYSRK